MPLRSASTTSPVTSTFSSLTAIGPPFDDGAGTDEPPRGGTPAPDSRTGLDDYDRLSLRALRALFGLELDLRALGEGLEALAADRAEMHEDVLTAVTRGDEPKALCIVEPLHGSGCHTNTSSHPSRERAKEAHHATTDTRSSTTVK